MPDRPDPPHLDVLRLPLVGRLLRWRWGRLSLQAPLLLLALLVVYDGLTGPQLAPANSATVLVWVLSRGLILLSLIGVGNLFCGACPFTLPRTLARRLSRPHRRFPGWLRNKWTSVTGLLLIFWAYEWLDLWASPALTAGLVLLYFVGSFALEAAYSESPFCKHVCPLGAFNFVGAAISPVQIGARENGICRTCPGKECLRGSAQVSGCGTELYVPQVTSNLDCTFCLDCARACPYDNVALRSRPFLAELLGKSWPGRWDVSFLPISLAFLALTNAFGMVRPVAAVHAWFGARLGLNAEWARVLVLTMIGGLALPGLVLTLCSWLGVQGGGGVGPARERRRIAARYAPAFVPLGLGFWLAHYGFHLAVGGLAIVPVLQAFALDHGLEWLDREPNWALSYLLPVEWIFPLQVVVVLAGLAGALLIAGRRALHSNREPVASLLELLPWAAVLVLLAVLALSLFNLPMEMRGTFAVPS